MHRIAIFASGNGTNAQRIIEYFQNNDQISVNLVISNKADAYVLERAEKLGVPSLVFSSHEFKEADHLLRRIQVLRIDFIVLAGFLLKVPDLLLHEFPNRIINIHPALLPSYGGKGMYGHHVHEAVIAAGDAESGISIHLVNENYDEGKVVFQAKCPVLPGDTADILASRIHELEHRWFPEVIEGWIVGKDEG
ncbi:MAG: phosphoribosylglycinamide formyltransferase [Bacteroidota bacterium]